MYDLQCINFSRRFCLFSALTTNPCALLLRIYFVDVYIHGFLLYMYPCSVSIAVFLHHCNISSASSLFLIVCLISFILIRFYCKCECKLNISKGNISYSANIELNGIPLTHSTLFLSHHSNAISKSATRKRKPILKM